jgi:hypothetical protein
MMRETMRHEELDRIDTLTIIQIVAYVKRLNIRLRSKDCTDEERKNGLELLERLTERVRFLETTLSPAFP